MQDYNNNHKKKLSLKIRINFNGIILLFKIWEIFAILFFQNIKIKLSINNKQ